MTEIQKYLAEEVAEDHADGIITRREAMRRLGLLGVGAATASTMLAAEALAKGGERSRPRSRARARHGNDGRSTEWAPVATRADHVRRARTGR